MLLLMRATWRHVAAITLAFSLRALAQTTPAPTTPAPSAAAQPAPPPAAFTLRDALSGPFSNQLTAAPVKNRVAWVSDREGRRSVWVAGDALRPHALVPDGADDGQDIDDLSWSADAEQVAWTRGTGSEGPEHPVANPAELPGPVQQRIFVADLRTGAAAGSVAEGHSPLFLPGGSTILFLRRGSIWIAPLAPGAALPPLPDRDGDEPSADEAAKPRAGRERQLLYTRGAASGLRLSPDGTRLAFVSHRGDHSFIAVYTFATRELRWMDPGTGLDHDPVWSPDSAALAFLREVPLVSPIADRWLRDGAPWSIRIASATTGEGRELWRAAVGPGSVFHGVVARDQLLWLRDGRLIFPWERTGWTQLYTIPAGAPAAGGSAKPLQRDASGNGYEVDAVSSDGARVVWSGNDPASSPADRDRRHIATSTGERLCPVSGFATTPDCSGIETSPVLLSGGSLVALAGDAQFPLVPVRLEELTSNGAERTGTRRCRSVPLVPELVPFTFPGGRFVTPQPVVFPARDGLRIHAQLFLPPHRTPGARLPAVVFFHGGSRRQMLLGYPAMQYYKQAYEFNQYLASRGFAVLSVNYRSGIGYGLDFRQAEHYGADGASEFNDVLGASDYLRTRADIDPGRIAAWGGSYGGYLTALALARASDRFAAGVDLHGVHDWSLELELWKPGDDPHADYAATARLAFASSPMASLDTWKSPVLLIQGDDDRNVLFAQTVRLAAELRKRGVPVEEKVFPDEVHDFLLHRHWLEAYTLAADFLERRLAGGAAAHP